MKSIIFGVDGRMNPQDEYPYIMPMMLPYSDGNVEIAKAQSYNGEYAIEDDGEPDPTQEPSQLDRVEAQAVYTAMMTDTLLESEV